MSRKVYRTPYGFLLLLLFLPALAFAQTSSPSLQGQVLDPSGAAVPALSVTVVGSGGAKVVVQTDNKASMPSAVWLRAHTP